MSENVSLKASVKKPWMRYFPSFLMEGRELPDSNVEEYLKDHCARDDVVAMHYYGNGITWKQVRDEVERTARALFSIGFRKKTEKAIRYHTDGRRMLHKGDIGYIQPTEVCTSLTVELLSVSAVQKAVSRL